MTPQARISAIDTAAHRPTFCGTPVTDDQWSVLVEIIDSCGLSHHQLVRTICEALEWDSYQGLPITKHSRPVMESL